MKHFFPFLMIPFIMCVFLHTFSMVSVSAQQHNSFASARYLSLDHTISVTLPANASEYYYFLSLHPTDSVNQQYELTLTEAGSLSVSVYNDQGTAIILKKTSTSTSNWTACIDNTSGSTRFFLVLHNQTNQDTAIRLSVKAFSPPVSAATPNSGSTSKNPTTPKPDKKPKQVTGSKAAATKKPGTTTRQDSGSKTTAKRKPRTTTKQDFDSKTTATRKPQTTTRQDSDSKTVIPGSKATPATTGYHNDSNTSLPKITPNNQNTKPQTPEYHSGYQRNHSVSRSDAILSQHFFRMSAGYSISAFKLLPINVTESTLKLENLTPETLTLQNNIIYAKTPGLAVIRIHHGNYTTSCTIYIQDSD